MPSYKQFIVGNDTLFNFLYICWKVFLREPGHLCFYTFSSVV